MFKFLFSKKKICKNIFIIYWDRVEVGSGWNSVSSLGSLVSLVATIVFKYKLYYDKVKNWEEYYI